MKKENLNEARDGGLPALTLLAIRTEGARNRLEVAFWANFVVLMCFQSENQIIQWTIMGVSAACMVGFSIIDRKMAKITDDLFDMANTTAQERYAIPDAQCSQKNFPAVE
jgi:hypothetical protein